MEEKEIIKSEKKNLKKVWKFLWKILGIIFIVTTVIGLINYRGYKKGQDASIDAMLLASDEFDSIKDKKELIEKMYSFLNPIPFSFRTEYGIIDNSDSINAADKTEEALKKVLKEFGYETYSGSYYLKYTNFIEYYFNEWIGLPLMVIILFCILLSLTIFIKLDKKSEIVITDNVITFKNMFGRTSQALLKDITSVNIIMFDGLKIIGNGFKHKIILIENNVVLEDKIMKLLRGIKSNERLNREEKDFSIEIKKYKELLDSGVITQEEFEKKKKELLNL